MKLTSLLHKEASHLSLAWHESSAIPGVRFAIRRASLQQRIDLNGKLRELTLKHEFLKSGDLSNQLEAGLIDLLVARLYIEWGLSEIEGLKIDGQQANAELLLAHGPEALSDEIVGAIEREIALTDEERKNS